MHSRTTNNAPQSFDDFRVRFESAGALAFDNEYSGLAVPPARNIAFAERKTAPRTSAIYSLGGLP